MKSFATPVIGCAVALAGLGLPYPLPLVTMVVGAGLLGVGLWWMSRETVPVQTPWDRRAALLTAAWIVGMIAVYVVLVRLLALALPVEAATALAAVAATVVFAGMLTWLRRRIYGPARRRQGHARRRASHARS